MPMVVDWVPNNSWLFLLTGKENRAELAHTEPHRAFGSGSMLVQQC